MTTALRHADMADQIRADLPNTSPAVVDGLLKNLAHHVRELSRNPGQFEAARDALAAWDDATRDGTPHWRIARSVADALRAVLPTEPEGQCAKCGVKVTGQTPSTFYSSHDETCGGDLSDPTEPEEKP